MDTGSDQHSAELQGLAQLLRELSPSVSSADVLDLAAVLLDSVRAAATTRNPVLAVDGIVLAADRLIGPGATPGQRVELRTQVRDRVLDILSRIEPDVDARTFLGGLALGDARTGDAAPLADPRARAYLGALLDVDHHEAVGIIRDLLHSGTPVDEVLVDVLEAVQREVGQLWQQGQISWATEHYCTAVTQRALSEIYPHLFVGRERDLRIVAVHAPGDKHHLGLRMVVDLLEHDGWTTTYLHEQADPARLPELISHAGATVVAISASMPGQIDAVRRMIAAVREDPRTRNTSVVVGGRPFALDPELAGAVGADGTAHDARSATALCRRLAMAAR